MSHSGCEEPDDAEATSTPSSKHHRLGPPGKPPSKKKPGPSRKKGCTEFRIGEEGVIRRARAAHVTPGAACAHRSGMKAPGFVLLVVEAPWSSGPECGLHPTHRVPGKVGGRRQLPPWPPEPGLSPPHAPRPVPATPGDGGARAQLAPSHMGRAGPRNAAGFQRAAVAQWPAALVPASVGSPRRVGAASPSQSRSRRCPPTPPQRAGALPRASP